MDAWDKLDRALRSLEELYSERDNGRPSIARLFRLARGWLFLRRLIWVEGGREVLSSNAHLADRFLTLQRQHRLSFIVKPGLASASF